MLITVPSPTDPDPTRTNPTDLPDAALIERVGALAGAARETTAEMIAHLVELERRNLHLACGFSSLYWYCREVLRFSEPESYQRMQAVHIAARFPVILPLLADGRLHLAGVRLLAPHLENEDHLALIGGALGQSKRKIEKLLACWFPRPAIPASIRKVSRRRVAAPAVGAPALSPTTSRGLTSEGGEAASPTEPDPPAAADSDARTKKGNASSTVPTAAKTAAPTATQTATQTATRTATPTAATTAAQTEVSTAASGEPAASGTKRRAHIAPLSATDYVVKFTANEEMIGRLRLAQELLSHSVPDGDIVEIIDRALMRLIEDEQRRRHAAPAPARRPAASRDLRPGSRTVSADVQRDVWARDEGQCAYLAADGRRCRERRFLEYHHLKPWIVGGPPSVANIALRCRAHNQYEAKVYFDPIREAMSAPRQGP